MRHWNSKQIFAAIKSLLMLANFQILYSFLQSYAVSNEYTLKCIFDLVGILFLHAQTDGISSVFGTCSDKYLTPSSQK